MKNFYLNLYDKVGLFLNGAEVDFDAYKEDPDFMREMFRIAMYRKYMEAYRNIHVSTDAKEKSPKEIKVNLAKAFIDRSVDFLVGNPPAMYAPDKYARLISPAINYIDKKAGFELFSLETATTGSVLGDTFVKVIWDEELKSARFQILDSEKTFVNYRTTERNRTVLDEAVVVWDGEYDVKGDGNMIPVLFKEKWTMTEMELGVEWIEREETDKDRFGWHPGRIVSTMFGVNTDRKFSDDDFKSKTIETKPNDLGFIPVVHFRNLIVPLEKYGRSDLVDVVDLNLNLNDAATQYLDAVRYHGSPITMIFGASTYTYIPQRGFRKSYCVPHH